MKACLTIAVLMIVSPAVAAGQQNCAPFPELKRSLAEKFHETEVGGGLINDKVMLSVFASPGGTSWTAVAIDVKGNACVMSVGTDWFANAPRATAKPGGKES